MRLHRLLCWIAVLGGCAHGGGNDSDARAGNTSERAPAHAEGTFEGPGGTLFYEVRGGRAGRPLVLINGGPGFDHTQLLVVPAAWDRLAQGRPVVLYDQRGTGRSFALKPGAPDTLEEQVADLEALRVHLAAETIDVAGHSSGGYIAMAYAARHPDRVSRLVLVDSGPLTPSEARDLLGELFPDVVARQAAVNASQDPSGQDAVNELRRLRRMMLFCSPENRDNYIKLAAHLPFSQQVNAALSEDINRLDLTPRARGFGMPVMIVTGRFDVVVPPSIAYKVHQQIPGSRFVIFERSGHLPFVEEPDAFATELESFLAN